MTHEPMHISCFKKTETGRQGLFEYIKDTLRPAQLILKNLHGATTFEKAEWRCEAFFLPPCWCGKICCLYKSAVRHMRFRFRTKCIAHNIFGFGLFEYLSTILRIWQLSYLKHIFEKRYLERTICDRQYLFELFCLIWVDKWLMVKHYPLIST